MKKARIIYNPSSGREQFKRHLPDCLEIMEKAGYETSCHATTGYKDATNAASLAVDRHFDLVVAAGGDGTVCEVINGMAEKTNRRPKLGIIPAGTTNDFARALGIPRQVDQACRTVVEGQARPIDIGKAGRQYFVNIAGGGTLTELTYEVPSKLKTMLGQLAYYVKGVEKLALFRPTAVKIRAREAVIEEEIMLFLVANSHSVGGFEKLAPRANLQDGYFDVLVVKKMSIPEFIRLATQAIRGEHLQDRRVIYFQSADLKVESVNPVQLNLDGERGGQLPCHFKVLHKHISMITPRTTHD